MVMECKNCKPHPFQDQKYGNRKRVHNKTKKSEGTVYRCTVCGTENSKR